MATFTFKAVSILATAETGGQAITFSTLDTTPGSSEGRSIGTLTVAPHVEIHMQGKRTVYATSITTAGFTAVASDVGDSLPINANIVVTTFEQVSTTSNAKSATVSKVRRILQINDTSGELVSDATIQERIDDAVEQYSLDKPLMKRHEIIGNSQQELDLPSDWSDRFSIVENIEYPAGAMPPNYIDGNEYFEELADETQRTIATASSGASSVTLSTVAHAGYFKGGEIIIVGDGDASETNWVSADGNATTGVVSLLNTTAALYDNSPYIRKKRHLKLLTLSPDSSDYMVIEYNLPHSHTDSSDTIPGADLEAVCHLAAAYTARSVSARFGKSTSGSFDGDLVNNIDKVQRWIDIAEQNESIYKKKLNLDEDKTITPFVGFVDIDSEYTHGREYLLHGRRVI